MTPKHRECLLINSFVDRFRSLCTDGGGGESEQATVSLQTVLTALCVYRRLLDMIENFTLFTEAQGALIKIF